ncbi:unnamed protein product [Acanthoscelides obtectus]|uniref:Hexosyltransferase n=1 Tax=Acanthoscelides obtectus TaxID=200917 RepID=A0A9P0Q3K9_ACAOB
MPFQEREEQTLAFSEFSTESVKRVKITNVLGQEEEVHKRTALEKVLLMGKPVTKNMRVCSKHFREKDYCGTGIRQQRLWKRQEGIKERQTDIPLSETASCAEQQLNTNLNREAPKSYENLSEEEIVVVQTLLDLGSDCDSTFVNKGVQVVGTVNSIKLQKNLEEENRKYNDLVQGAFLDTYRNITYKHVMALKYAIYHCPQARYILKTDDDVFVNMPAMNNFLRYELSPYGASRVLFCTPRKNANVIRSYRSKWRVSFQEYPNRTYPTYCPGWSLLYSPDVVFALYREAQMAEYFWIDDIHITGTLVERVKLKHTDIEFLVIPWRMLSDIVNYSCNVTQPFLYGRYNLKEGVIRALWLYVNTHPVPKYILKDIQY